MKHSPFQRCLHPPALTTFGGAWGPNVTPCRCLSCLLTPTRGGKRKKIRWGNRRQGDRKGEGAAARMREVEWERVRRRRGRRSRKWEVVMCKYPSLTAFTPRNAFLMWGIFIAHYAAAVWVPVMYLSVTIKLHSQKINRKKQSHQVDNGIFLRLLPADPF